MAVQTLKLAGKKFVIVEEGEYRALQKRASAGTARAKRRAQPRMTAQDRGDIAEAKRRMADPNKVMIPWEQVRDRLGRSK